MGFSRQQYWSGVPLPSPVLIIIAKSLKQSKFFSIGEWINKMLYTNIMHYYSGIKRKGVMIYLVKAMVFPVVMYGWESWTIKNAECWRTDASELWCWRRLLRVPWTARRSNQSVLKEISPEYSLEGLMLKLKLQYFATWCKELSHWKRP